MSKTNEKYTKVVNIDNASYVDFRCARAHYHPVTTTLAERIKWILEHKKLTQAELAKLAGVSRTYFSRYFDRVRKDPNATMHADNLAAIAKSTGISHPWLSLGEGSPHDTEDSSSRNNSMGSDHTDPRFGHLPNWPSLVRSAKLLAPDVPEEIFEAVAESYPLATTAITPGMIADLARVTQRYQDHPKFSAWLDKRTKAKKKST